MKLTLKKGIASKLLQVYIESTSGGGLTGLAYDTSGLIAYYYRETEVNPIAISLVDMPGGLSWWVSGGFIEVDAANMPGLYQFSVPNAVLDTGADSVTIMLSGAASMVPLVLEIELVNYDPNNAVSLGLGKLSALLGPDHFPNAPLFGDLDPHSIPSADCEARVTLAQITSDSQSDAVLFIRADSSSGPTTFYEVVASKSTLYPDSVLLEGSTSGVIAMWIVPGGFQNGDAIGIRAEGSNLRGFYCPVGGDWLEVIGVIDSTVPGPGYTLLEKDTVDWTLSDFAGGAVIAGSLADVYQAKLWMQDDNTNTSDRYVVCWYKNGEPVTTGITAPTIEVIQASDGADLVAEDDMTEIASTGLYRYDEATNRVADGAAYIAKVTATIDGATRTWYQPVGRDS